MNNWYYLVGENQFKPVSRNVLKTALQTGELSAQTFVYRDGFQDWVPAHQCEELGMAWPPASASVNLLEDRLPPVSSSPAEPFSLWWPRSWICGGTLSRAYERTSLIVTTNLPFEQWTEVLGSERLTGAMLDRLTHRVHILEANGASYRLQDAKRRLQQR